jgi:endonuclease/exonuclease/phosphatase family metal-dependent hydrolase
VDVVAFQEVWHEGAARALRAGLRALFPHQHRPAAYCGLLTVTRAGLPHAHARFAPFRNTAGVEGWWFTKGVAAVVVETEEATRENPYVAEPFAVLNAHAQSDFWASGAATRASQMTQTREMLNEIARERYSRLDSRDSACDITTLLVGDLNVAAGSEEYRAAMRALGDPTDILAADALTGTDAFTFPIGAYVSTTFEAFPLCLMGSESFGAYVPRTPTKRLDHALRFRKRGDERRAGEKKAASAAIVLAGLARGEDGAPLSDHAPIFAVVRR